MAKTRVRRHGLLVLLYRWHSGNTHDAQPITDAGWFRPGVRAMTPTGHATRFWHLPRWKRAAWRSGCSLTVLTWLWLWLLSPVAATCLLAVALAGCGYLGYRKLRTLIGGRRHRSTWLVPLHLAAHELAGIPRAALASSWVTAELDDEGAVRKAVLGPLPQGWPADAKDKARLVAIASAKLGIEAPEVSWRNAGPSPQVTIARSVAMPTLVTLGGVMDAIEATRWPQLVIGVGKHGGIVKASLAADSPHIGVSMGSGAGKSTFAALIIMQVLHQGGIVLVLDAKWLSHPWLIGLPNVAYVRSTAELHEAMEWLSTELDRRKEVALASVDIRGVVRANVGPNLLVVGEELNVAMDRLKAHWAEIRGKHDPKRSPALTGYAEASYTGRSLKMHLLSIGQQLTAKSTGSSDSSVRESHGLLALSRFSSRTWQMLAPQLAMPRIPNEPGRIQLITANGVREVQTPFIDLDHDPEPAREYAMSGTVTPCPAGMPGRQVTATGFPALKSGPDLPFVTVTDTPPLTAAPRLVSLSDAVRLGHVHPETTLAALRMARHRDDAFPERAGLRGMTHLYDPAALTAWDASRRAARA
jgi:hypothetical protein